MKKKNQLVKNSTENIFFSYQFIFEVQNMNALYNHFAQIKSLPHPTTTSADDPQVFSNIFFSAYYVFEILWFLVYLTILALIAVSLLLFTLICAAIV